MKNSILFIFAFLISSIFLSEVRAQEFRGNSASTIQRKISNCLQNGSTGSQCTNNTLRQLCSGAPNRSNCLSLGTRFIQNNVKVSASATSSSSNRSQSSRSNRSRASAPAQTRATSSANTQPAPMASEQVASETRSVASSGNACASTQPVLANNFGGWAAAANPYSENAIKSNSSKRNTAIKKALRQCQKDGEDGSKELSSPVTYPELDGCGVEVERTIATCEDANTLAEEHLDKDAAEKCVEAFEKFKDKVDEKSSTAEDDLKELQEAKIEAMDKSQEDTLRLQEDLDKATQAYEAAVQEYNKEIQELTEQLDEKSKAKVNEFSAAVKERDQILKTKLPQLNMMLRNEQNKCKNDAEQGYAKYVAELRKALKASGKQVNLNKLKGDFKLYHSECVSNANTSYQSQLEALLSDEAEINRKIQQLKTEVENIAGMEKLQKESQLGQKLQLVYQRTESEKQRIQQDMQRVSTTARQKIDVIEAQIRALKERVASGDFSGNRNSPPTWTHKCCEGEGRSATIKASISWYKGGLPPATQCRSATSGRSNSRSKR